jgi:4-amino-4-deoxy-L-arabinose transferase-like glycosyltransferase
MSGLRRDSRLRRVRPPAALAILLVAVACLGVTWALLNAPWQSPDETWHFAYAQSVAERAALPGGDRPTFSTEQVTADQYSLSSRLAFNSMLRAPFSESAYDSWSRVNAALPSSSRSDGGGTNAAGINPPFYYTYEAPAYLAAHGGGVFDRLYAMRIWSMLLLLAAVVGTWLLAGELFGRSRPLQLGAAAVVGLQPMATFMSTSVNPDGMLLALWAIGLWLGVRILRRGITWQQALALSAVAAAAALTKANGYLLVAAAGAVVAYSLWRMRGQGARRLARVATVSLVVVALPVGAWLAYTRAKDRPAVNEITSQTGAQVSVFDFSPSYFASYLWQFYLPKLSSQAALPGGISKDYGYDIWFGTGWGVFGWKDTRLPPNVYSALRWISFGVLLAAAIALILRRVRLGLPVALFLAFNFFGLLLALHWVEFRFVVERGEAFLQGRYLLPLLPIAACAGAAALTLVPARLRGAALGVGLAGLLALQILSLATILERYYA